MSRPPTLATVATRAGVSRQTVSNALNNPHLLREDTLTRVREAIEELGYQPNRAARSLRTQASYLVGLKVDPVRQGTPDTVMDRFLHQLVESAAEDGYHVLLFTSDDPDDPMAGYENLLRSTAVDAFVVTDTYRGNPQAAWLEQYQAPFVAFGRPWKEPEVEHPWVDVDGAAGVSRAVEHLIGLGHERIAWIGWERDSILGEERRCGWSEAMKRNRLPVAGLSGRGFDTTDTGYGVADEMLDDKRATAFVCASDTIALGVMHALSERGLHPGRDVAVVGFDDSNTAALVPPGLTSVRQPLEEVAMTLVEMLRDRLAHKPVEDQGVLLQPTLTVRRSTDPGAAPLSGRSTA